MASVSYHPPSAYVYPFCCFQWWQCSLCRQFSYLDVSIVSLKSIDSYCNTFSCFSLLFLLGLILLCQLKVKCGESMCRTKNSKVWEYIIRLTALLLTLIFCVVATIYCHAHHYVYEGQWQGALRQSILCRVGLIPSTGGDECSPSSRPNLSIYNLQVCPSICFI